MRSAGLLFTSLSVLALLGASTAGRRKLYPDHYPQYSFGYAIRDDYTGDAKGQEETREGGVVKGRYSLVEPDGTRRIVEYTADPVHGFNAVVHREPPVWTKPVVVQAQDYSHQPEHVAPAYSAARHEYTPHAHQQVADVAYAAPVHVPAHVPSHVPAHVPSHVPAHVPSHVPSHIPAHVPAHIPAPIPAPVPAVAYTAAPSPSPYTLFQYSPVPAQSPAKASPREAYSGYVPQSRYPEDEKKYHRPGLHTEAITHDPAIHGFRYK